MERNIINLMNLVENINLLNEKFGESEWNEFYQCYSCCFCNRLVALRYSEEKKLKESTLPSTINTEDWQNEIDRIAKEKGSHFGLMGSHFDYRQIIHKNCLPLLSQGQITLLKSRNRNNFPLPKRGSPLFIEIKNYHTISSNSQCLRCDTDIEAKNQGFVYKSGEGNRFIHYNCAEFIWSRQI